MLKEIDLISSELRAIEIHKYYLSQQEGREVSLEEALLDFQMNYESAFLQEKQREDVRDQVEEIRKYRWIESERAGHDVGEQKAAMEWIEKYGPIWREERESLERNGFLETAVIVARREGIRVRMGAFRELARRYDCDLYVHKDRMRYYNFVLNGKKEYLNVRSILSPGYFDAARGETIEFIAAGGGSREALEEAKRLIETSEENQGTHAS